MVTGAGRALEMGDYQATAAPADMGQQWDKNGTTMGRRNLSHNFAPHCSTGVGTKPVVAAPYTRTNEL